MWVPRKAVCPPRISSASLLWCLPFQEGLYEPFMSLKCLLNSEKTPYSIFHIEECLHYGKDDWKSVLFKEIVLRGKRISRGDRRGENMSEGRKRGENTGKEREWERSERRETRERGERGWGRREWRETREARKEERKSEEKGKTDEGKREVAGT